MKIKSTDKGLLYNYTSFIPDKYKRNLISCLVFIVFNIASSYKLFHIDKETLKSKFLRNGFTAWLFDSLVGKFLNNVYDPPPTSYTVPKVKVVIVLPYLGYISIYVSRKLRRLINKFFPMIDPRIIYSRGHSIRNMFPYIDKLPLKCPSGIVYHIQCDTVGQVWLILAKLPIHYTSVSMVPMDIYIRPLKEVLHWSILCRMSAQTVALTLIKSKYWIVATMISS